MKITTWTYKKRTDKIIQINKNETSMIERQAYSHGIENFQIETEEVEANMEREKGEGEKEEEEEEREEK